MEKGNREPIQTKIYENLPNLGRELDLPIQEANRTPNYLNTKRPAPRYIVLKLSKFNDEERILKAVREENSNLQRKHHQIIIRLLSRKFIGQDRVG